MKRIYTLATLAAVSASAVTTQVHAQQTIRMGALVTLEGPFAQSGQDGLRGVELALEEAGYMAGGKKIELIKESSNTKPDVAVAKTRKLIEQDKVDFVVGPLSGGEGLAVKEYAKTVPGKTFLNGTSGAQDTTLRNPAPNFFRFNTDGAQWQAGLGSYAYDVKKYRNIAVVSEDYSFPYSQVMGFQLEYCARGGKIAQKNWVPIGTKDYTSVIARLPEDVDAIYVLLGGSDAVNFFTQYYQSGGKANIIGGSVTVDRNVLSTKGAFRNKMVGLISAGPIADTNPDQKWVAFANAYKKKYSDGFGSPSLFAHGYYLNTKAALLALEQVKGDLGNNQQKFQQALASLKFNSPTGQVSLDENRQGIGDNYVTEVVQSANGVFQNKLVKTAAAVPQTLGLSREAFLKLGPASRDNPGCQAKQ